MKETRAPCAGLNLREDDGDGSRVFVLQVVGEDHFVDVAELVPHRPARGTANFLHDLADAVVEDLRQQPSWTWSLPTRAPVLEMDSAKSRSRSSTDWALMVPRCADRGRDSVRIVVVHHPHQRAGVRLAKRDRKIAAFSAPLILYVHLLGSGHCGAHCSPCSQSRWMIPGILPVSSDDLADAL